MRLPRLQIPLFGGRTASSEPPPGGSTGELPSGLSTFGGVFTPSILTILGVIMYLRLGWVVGSVGLAGTLLIITISSGITFLTALSVAQIATDRVVRVGGAYYMISRSLGIEAGGAVGIPLYFAQALSVALYTIGFAESLARTFAHLDQRLVALITTVLVALLAIKSAKIAIRAQYFIMAAIALSIVSLIAGHPLDENPIGLTGSPVPNAPGFWTVFAVFFPAVTGIMAGVNMSGDLEDSAKSIPRGTLYAVGTGYLIYMLLPLLLVARVSAETLVSDPLVMRRIAFWGDAILLGVWGATLSSAVGSILGAPRVLQALARDGVLPRFLSFLGSGSGPQDEPRVGTAVTLGVALAAVALGNLDLIAPILTMFFLTTYLVLNLVAGVERFLDSPSFRPSYSVHWSLSLLGALGCLGVMLLINPVATVLAAVTILGIYLWLERRELQAAWGDVRNGIWMELVRAGVMRADAQPDLRNWRPHLLVLSGSPTRRWSLIELAVALTRNRGMMTVASVLPEGSRTPAQRRAMEGTVRDYMSKRGVEGLVRVITAPNPYTGAQILVEAYGLGPLVPNTVLLGASHDLAQRDAYCQMVISFHRSERHVVILKEAERGFGNHRRIDIWWGGLQENGGLMLVLAHLLRSGLAWRGAEIRLKLVVPGEAAAEAARTNLERVVESLRIGARPEILMADERPFPEILHTESAEADLIFLGIAHPEPATPGLTEETQDDSCEVRTVGGLFRTDYERLVGWTEGLPTTALVLAASGVELSRVLMEDGPRPTGRSGDGG